MIGSDEPHSPTAKNEELDPEAWERPWNGQRTSFPAHPSTGYRFNPRSEYSQDIEDYI